MSDGLGPAALGGLLRLLLLLYFDAQAVEQRVDVVDPWVFRLDEEYFFIGLFFRRSITWLISEGYLLYLLQFILNGSRIGIQGRFPY